MKPYLDIVSRILDTGVLKDNRTGTRAYTVAGAMFEHDMSLGFPLLTTKAVPFRLIASELEFFIRGGSNKEWLKNRDNHIWDEWARPSKARYGHSSDAKERMTTESDLGPIYGFQWRHYNAMYLDEHTDYTHQGVDQLKKVVDMLKSNPNDRRMIVMAWNPIQIADMALPPCHYGFQVTVINGALNLLWNQRSVDVMLGLPFNIASYALLLHLLAKEAKLKEGKLVGFLADVHIYENHLEGAREQIARDPNLYPLPTIETPAFTSIFDWQYVDTSLKNYQHQPKISFPIAV